MAGRDSHKETGLAGDEFSLVASTHTCDGQNHRIEDRSNGKVLRTEPAGSHDMGDLTEAIYLHPTAREILWLLHDRRKGDDISNRWDGQWEEGPPGDESARILTLLGDRQAPCQSNLTPDGHLALTLHPGDNVVCGVAPGGLIEINGPREGCQIVCTKKLWICLSVPPELAARAADGEYAARIDLRSDKVLPTCWSGLHILELPERYLKPAEEPLPPPASTGDRQAPKARRRWAPMVVQEGKHLNSGRTAGLLKSAHSRRLATRLGQPARQHGTPPASPCRTSSGSPLPHHSRPRGLDGRPH